MQTQGIQNGQCEKFSLGRQRKSNAQRTASSLTCLRDNFEGKIPTGIKLEVDAWMFIQKLMFQNKVSRVGLDSAL